MAEGGLAPRQLNQVVILGGGQAGAQVAMSLRQAGYGGAIILVGDEAALPYQRPPLSKAFLKGELPEERLQFKPESWYDDAGIDLVLSTRAEAIDRQARVVALQHGGRVAYDALVIATGSRPRTLPVEGARLEGVHELRTLADVNRLRPEMVEGRSIVIIGAGYIGLETAAVARQMSLQVTVVEMAGRVLARVTSPVMSDFYTRLHERHGVTIRTGMRVSAITGSGGRVSGVTLTDGGHMPADLVLVGIGIVPNVELAAEAGLACRDGILVDRDARTSDPRVFAAGDCARRPLVHYGRSGRLQSVHNAIEQGKLAVASMLGRARPAEDAPWFWSDQYDAKLQIAGLSEGAQQVVVRGDPDAGRFAAFYFIGDRPVAVDAVSSPPDFLVMKKLILSGARIAPEVLRDTSVSMKEIAALAA